MKNIEGLPKCSSYCLALVLHFVCPGDGGDCEKVNDLTAELNALKGTG